MIRKPAFTGALFDAIRRMRSKPEEKGEHKTERKVVPELKLFKQQVTLHIRVINAKSGRAIKGAEVALNNRAEKTGNEGGVIFQNISTGEHEIAARREGYETKKSVYAVEKNKIDIPLLPTYKIDDAQLKRLNSIRALTERNLQMISSPDPCLPSYYASIGSKMVDFAEGILTTPEYFQLNNYGEAAEELIKVTEEVSKNLAEILLDWRNVRLYTASKLKGDKCAAKDFVDEEMFDKILENPKHFADARFPIVKERMAILDSLINEKIKELTILPVCGLWGISKRLLDASVSPTTGEIKRGIYIMVADIMLKYVEEMLQNQNILSRLKYTIF